MGWIGTGFFACHLATSGAEAKTEPATRPVPAPGPVVISEFMAANDTTATDESGRFEDWIELRNQGTEPVDLAGWTLRNSAKATAAWTFPSTNLPPGGHLIVWASGRNRRVPGRALHTSFRLAADGEYLALGRPDGTLSTAFSPKYPPQWPDVSFGFPANNAQPIRFTTPTPGRPNTTPGRSPGPFIEGLTHQPAAGDAPAALEIQSRIQPTLAPVSKATLVWRTGFGSEVSLPMNRGDNGVWTASIPTRGLNPGSLVRWRVEATDEAKGQATYPPRTRSTKTSEYLGTVLGADRVRSALPVIHLFVPRDGENSMDSEEGTRGCLFHNGELYDRVLIKIRGNSTVAFPKRSHRVEFPSDHRFRYPSPGPRVRATSLMAEWGDPTYLRQHLSFWLQAQTGSAAPFHEPVRVELNGAFWQLAMLSEVLGEDLLTRHGLDPDGALYKAVGTLDPWENSTGGFEKKTRRHENNRDYTVLAQSLLPRGGIESRRRALYERFHLPSVINYLAVARLTQEDDDIWANLSLYHDNDGTDEWRPIPFDMNVSWGFSFAMSGVQAERDAHRSHPFFGASRTGNLQGINQLYDAVVQVPETRAMFLRRLRTVMDRWLQPPGTPPEERILERHIQELAQRMAPEAALDRARWGNCWNSPSGASPADAFRLGIEALTSRFIEPRRRHLFVTHCVSNGGLLRRVGITASDVAGIPLSQPERPPIQLRTGPAGTMPGEPTPVVVGNPGSDAIDLSGWSLAGPVTFTFAPGTVLPPAGSLHVAANVRTFRSRQDPAASGDEPRFVVGPLAVAKGTTAAPLILRDDAGRELARLDSR